MNSDHSTPWTAFYVRDEQQFHLLDIHGSSVGTIGAEEVARKIVRLVNANARHNTRPECIADVIPLATRNTVDAPPAPDPSKGAATAWDELFDHLIYLLDAGEKQALRERLFAYARVTVGLPLPSVFMTDSGQGSDA